MVRRLIEMGFVVVVLDDLSTGYEENLPLDLCGRLFLIRGSVLDNPLIQNIVKEVKFIFHLANLVGFERVYNNEGLTYSTSVEGTQNILQATRHIPIVLFSSSSVYGLDCPGKARENNNIDENNLLAYDGGRRGYACGKWRMELLGRREASAGRPVMIVRPFNVVGQGQAESYGMVLPRFIDQAGKGEALTIYGSGLQSRCFSDVHTFIDCVMELVNHPEAWLYPNNVVNLGNDVSTTILELAEIVIRETYSGSSVNFVSYKDKYPGKEDVYRRVPDIRRLQDFLGPVAWPDVSVIVEKMCVTAPADVAWGENRGKAHAYD